MRFTKIRLAGLTSIDLPISGAMPSDRYILKEVDGLGPPEVDVSIADTLNAGGVYQGRRPQNREIVLKIGLNPDYSSGQTASDMRTYFYGMLTPGSTDEVGVFVLNDANVVACTTGYVKKLEISPFSKDPEVQITIACVWPYLQAPMVLYVDPSGKSTPEIENSGTAPSGFHMEVIFTQPASSWVLTDATGKKMEFVYDFLVDDKLSFDTRPGYRSINLERNLITSNILYSLSANSEWVMLYGGLNTFVSSSSDFNWGDVYYTPQYWGI